MNRTNEPPTGFPPLVSDPSKTMMRQRPLPQSQCPPSSIVAGSSSSSWAKVAETEPAVAALPAQHQPNTPPKPPTLSLLIPSSKKKKSKKRKGNARGSVGTGRNKQEKEGGAKKNLAVSSSMTPKKQMARRGNIPAPQASEESEEWTKVTTKNKTQSIQETNRSMISKTMVVSTPPQRVKKSGGGASSAKRNQPASQISCPSGRFGTIGG